MLATVVPENVLICSVLLGFAIYAGYLAKIHGLVYLPESALAMTFGIIFGMVSQILNLDYDFQFSGEVFFYALLPIIIFNAGFSLKKKEFFKNFGAITLFAVLGTIISALVYGIFTFYLYKLGYISHLNADHPLLEALMFGSLISAIDPVATLSIFHDVHAPSTLYNLVFGESLVNDASSIVLFRTFESFLKSDFTLSTIGTAIFCFCLISIGSLALGVLVSFLCALILRSIENHSKYSKFELAFILLSAYMSYAVAEMLGLSGIMSLFFCGICNSHYSFYNVCHASKISSKYSFEALAFMSELFVFAYLGMQVVVLKHEFDIGLILSAIPLCLLSRALNVFPLSFLANMYRKEKITGNMQIMMWLSGLRGAIAFALSVNFPGDNRAIESTTLFIVVFTTLVLGSTTSSTLSFLGLISGSSKEHSRSGLDAPLIASEDATSIEVRENKLGFHKWFREMDAKYLKPLLGGHLTSRISEQEDNVLDQEIPQVEYQQYLGNNFHLRIPKEWTENLRILKSEGVLIHFVSSNETGRPPCSVTVSRVSIHGVQSIMEFESPMAFLSEKWEELDLAGSKTLASLEASLAELGNPRRFPVARLGSFPRVLSYSGKKSSAHSESSEELHTGNEDNENENDSWTLKRSLPRLKSVTEMPRDPTGLAVEGKNFPTSSSVGSAAEEFGLLSSKKSSLSNVLPGQDNGGTNLIPAFVMWTETAQDFDGRFYFRYELVVHPHDLGASETTVVNHVLISATDCNGHLLVCQIKAEESWWYSGGFRVAKSIIDSFRVSR